MTASDFTTQDALTSQPVRLVVRGMKTLFNTYRNNLWRVVNILFLISENFHSLVVQSTHSFSSENNNSENIYIYQNQFVLSCDA